ncbi:capsular polysaccharide biosynthesis protein [Caldalkalibacillus uzonensis]|uniref:Capsular polysaccharide biosynthesis protein n=1 Tax=Caldalkalibacillus uzonensis TaxID=353224 RepID=A0ABU0CMG5_9BACI|nr:capsular polysaccharide biosynthesis protein [Caldalkalibacillus uzonensis]
MKDKKSPAKKVQDTQKAFRQYNSGPSIIKTQDVIREVASKKIRFENPLANC